jgi:hypothetical protein
MIVTEEIYNTGHDAASVSLTYDNVTGAVSKISWKVNLAVLMVFRP